MRTEDLIRALVWDSLIFRKRGASIERVTTFCTVVARLDMALVNQTDSEDRLQLVAGMSDEVYIRTQYRILFDYLVEPLHEQIARTFRER